jgi:DNA modification methylase
MTARRTEQIGDCTLYLGDCLEVLSAMPSASAHTCVTSPPYFGLRDYGHGGQIGLEPTPDEYVAKLVAVFREVRRVLRDDGTLWLNLGDSYNNFRSQMGPGQAVHGRAKLNGKPDITSRRRGWDGVKEKDLLGIPWRVAFALQADGWYLRQDIIWHKPNPMPESVRDRCTKAHEYIFLLSKSAKYHFDAAAIAEPLAASSVARLSQSTLDQQVESARVPGKTNGNMKAVGPRFGGAKYGDDRRDESRTKSGNEWAGASTGNRNKRSVWSVTTKPYKGAHFATFPPDLIEPCILAGCPAGGTVLDPFGGSGTTAAVALSHGRRATLIELNPAYADLVRERLPAPTLTFPEAAE